ncbi:MAG TPA: sulfatase-like hydrolase/transferase [Anaerolineae bacterium]|nr:sulfatase-like hydrolase/transferase [Anaerolineae bacterium]
MMKLTRRDLLKSAALLPFLTGDWRSLAAPPPLQAAAAPNVLIVLFDSFSACHASLYGYPRQTTPHLARFAERATVYHAHYAAGNFTNPGTASLLTGTYPWTHRSLQLFSPMLKAVAPHNLFAAFAEKSYHRLTYTHNLVALALLYQCIEDVDTFKKIRDLCLLDAQWADKLFFNDYDLAIWRERLFRGGEGLSTLPTSLFYFFANHAGWERKKARLNHIYREQFPRDLPRHHDQIFRLEEAVDWLTASLPDFPQPYLGYFHFSPPHDPYNTRREFVGMFDAGWTPAPKPPHFFTLGHSEESLQQLRREYDEYLAYVDAEFGRLYEFMAQAGLLDNTYLVLTSDHGEMFERGIWMHLTQTLYEPVVRIPLLIAKPGQRIREDVRTPTSAVDVMPSLLHATGQTIPTWCEGRLLPTFGDEPVDPDRSIFVVEAKANAKSAALTQATFAMVKGAYKLVHYRGYPGYENEFELYDVQQDPEELENLYTTQKDVAADLRHELVSKVDEVNRPYVRG